MSARVPKAYRSPYPRDPGRRAVAKLHRVNWMLMNEVWRDLYWAVHEDAPKAAKTMPPAVLAELLEQIKYLQDRFLWLLVETYTESRKFNALRIDRKMREAPTAPATKGRA